MALDDIRFANLLDESGSERGGTDIPVCDRPRAPRALLFDMDGTLTEPYLDFEAIRREMGIAPGCWLLEAIAAMPPTERAAAESMLHRHEEAAATDQRS